MPNLLQHILEKAKSHTSSEIRLFGPLTSPPPEITQVEKFLNRKRRRVDKYKHIRAKVDTSPPPYLPHDKIYKLLSWNANLTRIYVDNVQLLTDMKRLHYTRQPKVQTTASLHRDWQYNRAHMVQQAEGKFILFPPVPQQEIEDSGFLCPKGVKRPRVYMTLKVKGHAPLGTLVIELFTDVCPNTCKLFLDLFDGDGVGYGYVGTKFFRTVPGLYWRGGDVVYNNGFGCYAQKGRVIPIGAENYHFPHSMPGLLSMSVTQDDEMCGIFNIIFKPLLQFDLHHVVFGRVIRPSAVFNVIKLLGTPLSSYPEIEVLSTKRKVRDSWIYGTPNTNILSLRPTQCIEK